jgi:sigma-B regulation protein RsbU (phosphoserine phosphatase)
VDQQKAAVGRISRAVARVQHLIGDLLDFTQARLGRGVSVRPGAVDLHKTVADGVAELRIAFAHRTIVHESAGPGQCVADPERIVQAIGNLVANALNHGPADGAVTVRTEGDANGFRLSVHNPGEPIPAALQARLFEPMVRGDPGSASKGVGLGLYIVRQIAQAHGGTVRVHSAAGSGTTFAIELPPAATGDARTPAAPASDRASHPRT